MARYNFKTIEPKWQARWEAEQTFRTVLDTSKPKYYVLDMFPYPSGSTLHIGHPKGYTATDIVARFKRMQGFNVLHPMGWDAFGLPAERAAVRSGRHPAEITQENIATFRRQLKRLGFSYDWSRELSTTDEDYYRWTQWIFLQLYNKGLAYLAEVPVNWCPAQGTVLANEEVQDGKYIETGDPVERRMMRQWMMKITAYADRLVDELDGLDWPESVKQMQRNWVGRSVGASAQFTIQGHNESLEIFTTRPDTLFGATFCVLAPEHKLVSQITTAAQRAAVTAYVDWAKNVSDRDREIASAKTKTGCFTGAYAINPINNQPIPIWVADYVKADYGSGAIMAVPAHDERDYDFAKAHNLPIVQVIDGAGYSPDAAFTGDGVLVNSDFLNGLNVPAAKQKAIDWLVANNHGSARTTYKLRDWLFSRQRYWGEPFPIAHAPDGTIVPLPEDALPITLPHIDEYKPTATGDPPLARADNSWRKVQLSGQELERETNTMPQWAGSCWYYLRFMDPKNNKAFAAPEALKYWGMVDLYIGGVEHAVLHLLYSRFWHKVLFDCGLVPHAEPFQKLFNQGLITGYSFKDARGKYYPPEEVELRDDKAFIKGTQTELQQQVEKISKSKLNGASADSVVDAYGADALRLYEMFLGPLEASAPWQLNGITGVYGFLEKFWNWLVDVETGSIKTSVQGLAEDAAPLAARRKLHQTLCKVTADIEALRLNTAIASMMECLNALRGLDVVPRSMAESFTLLLAPFAPHMAEEIWQLLGHKESLAYAPWPKWDAALLEEDEVTIAVQVNGKLRTTLVVAKDTPNDVLEKMALAESKVQTALTTAGITTPKKVIVVPNKIVNVVG